MFADKHNSHCTMRNAFVNIGFIVRCFGFSSVFNVGFKTSTPRLYIWSFSCTPCCCVFKQGDYICLILETYWIQFSVGLLLNMIKTNMRKWIFSYVALNMTVLWYFYAGLFIKLLILCEWILKQASRWSYQHQGLIRYAYH